uniref:Uncharacterized protein n=1 Tax=Micrurus carvalhoi TaxID=3147026 RepID=A0A2H6N263_9SAUR
MAVLCIDWVCLKLHKKAKWSQAWWGGRGSGSPGRGGMGRISGALLNVLRSCLVITTRRTRIAVTEKSNHVSISLNDHFAQDCANWDSGPSCAYKSMIACIYKTATDQQEREFPSSFVFLFFLNKFY